MLGHTPEQRLPDCPRNGNITANIKTVIFGIWVNILQNILLAYFRHITN
jgi:hypothetical protein